MLVHPELSKEANYHRYNDHKHSNTTSPKEGVKKPDTKKIQERCFQHRVYAYILMVTDEVMHYA